jgi:flagellar M-ring protein FliF
VWQRFFGTTWQQGKELLGRLSPSQRLTMGILGLTVFLGLLVIAVFAGRGSYVALARHRNVTELQAMAVQLREAGYAVRVNDGALEVKENQLPRALSYVAAEVASTPRRDGWAWLDKDPSWGETSVRQREKSRRARTINLEESIKVCPDVADALVVMNVKNAPTTVLSPDDGENSASVTVTLAPGVGRLKPGQVRVIRSIVSGGAPIPFRKVSVTDNRLNPYPIEEEESGGLAGFDERRHAHIKDYRQRIAEYLEQTFRRCEYSLFVDVKLRRDRVQRSSEKIEPPKKGVLTEEIVEKHTGRRDIGGRAPGTKSNVSAKLLGPGESAPQVAGGELTTVDTEELDKTERRYAPLVSRMHEERSTPAGAIEKISVAVRVDKRALEKVVGELKGLRATPEELADDPTARKELDANVEDYLQEREKQIEGMLRIHGADGAQDPISVSVRPDWLLAADGLVAAAGAPAGGVWQWAREHAILMTLAALGFAALTFAYSLARRAIPPPIEIPSIEMPEDDLVVEGDAAEGGAEQEEEVPEITLEDKEFSDSLGQVESVVRDKPNLAASVVKLWVADQEGRGKK